MIRFRGELVLRLVVDQAGRADTKGGRCQWAIAGDRPSAELEGGVEIYLEANSTTDLASIPRVFWSLLPPDGPWILPAAFHDDLYRKRGEVARLGHPAPFTRAEADAILRDGMKAVGVPAWKRSLIYRAVRAGGGRAWGT